MPHPEHHPTDDTIRTEAAASKARVRRQLKAVLEAEVQEAQDDSLFADLPWKDPSHSGEFEAVLT
jgi:hypothetical protein